jgi:nucleotide-binding universal stress UspA family protein
MSLFHRVVIAIDESAAAADARALAATLAAPGAELITAHVAAGHHETAEVQADVTLSGAFAGALDGLVRERSADLVVLGAHHHGHLWSANHTHSALHHLSCSVAVAPDGYGDAEPAPFATIGVAYDETTPEAEAALTAARRLAHPSGAEVRVIEVVRDSNLPSSASTQGWKAQQAETRLAALGGVSVTVLEGDPVHRLREAAADLDLLVLGRHHPSALAALLLDNTTDAIVGHVSCPLLVHSAGTI